MYRFVTSEQRSELMRKIRSNNTKPELLLRSKLWGQGLRFSRKTSKLPGKPDIVLEKPRVAIFIDGEFWHGYKWREKKKKIKANRRYWVPKIERNILRDKRNSQKLRKSGWKVIRFWEHQITKDLLKCIKKIKELKKSPLK
ncbi:MAG: very short patch repair endonuclease [Candidatus Omnitrophica bacterium]|jgi:DNA mismatch endonuclease (patch repair protein)|nr:very short patch repair endonuclease [Candidatus Omnitrophota bacterium]